MSYYEHNIADLKQHRSNIYEKMIDTDSAASDNQLEQIITETAINGEAILYLQKDGIQIRLNSNYHPTHEARIWAEQFSLSNLNNVITMFGLGNGLFAKEIATRLDKQDFLFIYEPSQQIFSHVLQEYDLTELLKNKNVILMVEGINDFDFHNLFQNAVNITNLSIQIQCAHPFYNELFAESYIKFWREIKDTMVHVKININTEILFGKRLIVNSFNNVKHIMNSNILEDFTMDIDRDIPAIIVAAGPSVRENIEELKKAKGKAYIFVVDRVLDYVLDNGLEPDFIVTIDPIKPVEYFSTRDNLTIPLLSDIASNWEVLKAHKGKKIFYNSNGYFQKMYHKVEKNPPFMITGSSVATAAFAVCVKLGFDKIVLVGQDLAYDGEVTHAGGVVESFDDGTEDFMVEGVDGNPARTRYDWYEFLTWFKDIIVLYPNIQVIDTKARGAKIQGSILMPMKEVLEKYCTKETGLDQLLSEKKGTFNEEELGKVRKYFEDSLDDLYDLKKKAKEALALCDRQINEYNTKSSETELTIKNFKRISKINKVIHEKPVYYLLDSYITALTVNYITKMYQFTDDLHTDRIETYEKSKKIYQAIIDGVEYATPQLLVVLEQFN